MTTKFPKRFVTKKELKSLFGVPYSLAHIARLEAAGKFPKRVVLGPNRVAYVAEEIEAYIEQLIAQRDTA